MSDNELLLSISNMLKTELKPLNTRIEQLEKNIDQVKLEVKKTNIIIENHIQPDIKLLAENYLPSAQRYEISTSEIECIKQDVTLLKKVVAEHSEHIKKLAWLYNIISTRTKSVKPIELLSSILLLKKLDLLCILYAKET